MPTGTCQNPEYSETWRIVLATAPVWAAELADAETPEYSPDIPSSPSDTEGTKWVTGSRHVSLLWQTCPFGLSSALQLQGWGLTAGVLAGNWGLSPGS